MPSQTHRAHVGDVVVVAGHRVGEAKRTGEILAVLGENAQEHYRVRWQDGHESIYRPGSDAVVEHRPRRAKAKAGRT
jgi:hypothetical protein